MQRCQRGKLCDSSNWSNTPTARQHLSAGMTSWQDPQNTALCSKPQLPYKTSEEARGATEKGIWLVTGCCCQPTTTMRGEGRAPATALGAPLSTSSTPELIYHVRKRFQVPWKKKKTVTRITRGCLLIKLNNVSRNAQLLKA